MATAVAIEQQPSLPPPAIPAAPAAEPSTDSVASIDAISTKAPPPPDESRDAAKRKREAPGGDTLIGTASKRVRGAEKESTLRTEAPGAASDHDEDDAEVADEADEAAADDAVRNQDGHADDDDGDGDEGGDDAKTTSTTTARPAAPRPESKDRHRREAVPSSSSSSRNRAERAQAALLEMLSVPRRWPEPVIPLKPMDRILFSYDQRTYEGIVLAVSMSSAKVTARTFKPPNANKHLVHQFHIRNVKGDANFHLFSMFRASSDMNPRAGEYVEFNQRDLWLEVDDVLELTAQGARCSVDSATNAMRTPTWIGRVNSVRSGEALVNCWPNPTNPLQPGDRPPPPHSTRAPSLSEWIPRNTLRFIRFFRRAAQAPSVHLTFLPAIVTTHS